MKLNKNTKHEVQAGDFLRFESGGVYEVQSVHAGTDRRGSRNALSFTIRNMENGRVIYCCPSSELYGAEIVKGLK